MFESIGARSPAWAGRTAEEIRTVAERDGSILVLPIGSIEQHGHHLPVATDSILVDAIAHLGAERVADDVPVLVAPPFWTGYSPHHLSFGGTLSLSFETMQAAIEEVAGTALENGFDALVFLNGHGGNGPLVDAVTSSVGVESDDARVFGLTYFELAASFGDEIRESDTGGMAHGGEFETALMLYLRPDLVQEDAIAAPSMEEPYDQASQDLLVGGPLSVYRGFDEYSDTGAIGDPGLASADQGERIYERLGDELAALLREIHEREGT